IHKAIWNRKYLFLLGLSIFSLQVWGQAKLQGTLSDEQGQPIEFASLILLDTDFTAISDDRGQFLIEDIPHDLYTLRASYLGYEEVEITVDLRQQSSMVIAIALQPVSTNLETVTVTAKSEARILSERPLAITSIDFSDLQNSTLDASSLLDRVNGVRVRQTGGLGSAINISIQGAQGNAVRRYFDGLPIRFLAAGLDLNNLPVNQIDRVDIYRGITPLEVGTDALGGGINIVPKRFYQRQVDVSYQIGSFQTHRASLNAFFINDKKWFVGTNAFFNYSANNYPIDAHDYNEETRRAENNIIVRRFHDTFRSYYGDLFFGFRDRPGVDELKITLSYNDLYDEVQTPVVFNPVRPLGALFTQTGGWTANLDYRWQTPNQRWQLLAKTNLGIYQDFIQDSTDYFFNWYGERLETPNNRGADLLSMPASISIDKQIYLQRLTARYQINRNHQLSVSNLFVGQNREGRNAFLPAEEDPFRFPAFLRQNYGGLAWDGKWWDQKITTTLTYKNYHYWAEATSLEDAIDQDFEQQMVSNNYHGGNLALKYAFNANTFIRSSFELAYRLPEENELFGNQSTIRSNINLRPERSENWNLGLFWKFLVFDQPVAIEVNGFYRQQQDRIILLASGFDLAQFFNEEEVEITGLDGYLSWKPWNWLHLNASATFQDIRIRSALVEADEDLIGTRLPNIPTFFARMDISFVQEGLLGQEDQFRLGYFYDFTDSFSSVREANAIQNIGNFVPTQHVNSLEVNYTWYQSRLHISLRANNIFDDDLYDNFRIQRPGRHFVAKIRYTL
ncbi:MAG: TonB-dependent receptor, partial [Bacteroidota bacterium]